MKKCGVIVLFLMSLLSFLPLHSHMLNFFSSSKKTELQDIVTHKTPLYDQYEFVFKGKPECLVQVNNFEDEQLLKTKQKINLFTKTGFLFNKGIIAELNNRSCFDDYCMRVDVAKNAQEGLYYTIKVNPSKYAFEYRVIKNDLQGNYKIQINFYNQMVLSLIDSNTPSMIIRSA